MYWEFASYTKSIHGHECPNPLKMKLKKSRFGRNCYTGHYLHCTENLYLDCLILCAKAGTCGILATVFGNICNNNDNEYICVEIKD